MNKTDIASIGIVTALTVTLVACSPDESPTPEPGATVMKVYEPNGSNKHPLTVTYLGDVNGYGLYSFCDDGARIYFHDTSYGGKIAAVLDTKCVGR